MMILRINGDAEMSMSITYLVSTVHILVMCTQYNGNSPYSTLLFTSCQLTQAYLHIWISLLTVYDTEYVEDKNMATQPHIDRIYTHYCVHSADLSPNTSPQCKARPP